MRFLTRDILNTATSSTRHAPFVLLGTRQVDVLLDDHELLLAVAALACEVAADRLTREDAQAFVASRSERGSVATG